MNRRLLLVAAMAAIPLTALAQSSGKQWRIGYLSSGPRPADGSVPAALRLGLAELGYAEGRNLQFEARWAHGDAKRLPALAQELVASRVNAVVAVGFPPAAAMRQATNGVPVVLVSAGDAVESGLVRSLGHPGGNITGLSDMSIDLAAKRVEVLKDAVPNARRLAVLWNKDDRAMTLRFQQIENAARALALQVKALGVRDTADFDAAFAAMSRERPDAMFVVSDVLTSGNRRRIIEYAAANRIPTMYEFGSYVQDGGLIAYGPSIEDIFHRAAYYIDRLFKGSKASDLPMEQPTRTYLYINVATAKAMGLPLSQTMLFRADKVIE